MAKTDFFNLRLIFKAFQLGSYTLMIFLCSCLSGKEESKAESIRSLNDLNRESGIRHAVGFNLIDYLDYKILHLFRHYNNSVDTLSYVLFKEGAIIDKQFKSLSKVQVPIKKIALLHSSYVSFFELCQTTDLIKAISEVKYVYDDQIYTAVKNDLIKEVGYGETLNKEKLLELGISAVVTVGWPNTPNKSQQLLEELGIPVLIFSDWQETTLLGRAEWVKVVAALTGAEELAYEKFKETEQEYNRLASLVVSIRDNPTVICNLPYKGSWYMPGGNSYMSNVIEDAGGTYLWSDDEGIGGIQIDFEMVYAKGIAADFWINPGTSKSIGEITGQDERLKDFQPVKEGKVFNYINRVVRGSANDYWESAMTHPHLILADYIKILHPEVLPDYDLFYYKQLN